MNSKEKYFQKLTLKGVDKQHQEAVAVYLTLAELNLQVVSKEDREAWEQLWNEYKESPNWGRASWVIGRYGI